MLDTGSRGEKDAGINGSIDNSDHHHHLRLVARIPSGGTHPVSVTSNENILYVLNAGVPNNISGFRVSNNGNLTPIDGSTQPLSAADTGPAEVQFSTNGRVLVVTEKATNILDTYTIDFSWRSRQPLTFRPQRAQPPTASRSTIATTLSYLKHSAAPPMAQPHRPTASTTQAFSPR